MVRCREVPQAFPQMGGLQTHAGLSLEKAAGRSLGQVTRTRVTQPQDRGQAGASPEGPSEAILHLAVVLLPHSSVARSGALVWFGHYPGLRFACPGLRPMALFRAKDLLSPMVLHEGRKTLTTNARLENACAIRGIC